MRQKNIIDNSRPDPIPDPIPAIAFGTIGTGNGMGQGLNGATNAVGRNPEAQGKILLTMMVGLAMIESLAIYALVVALIVLYANPLIKLIG